MDATLHLAPFNLSPRLPERDKAAAAKPSGHGSRNLLLELLVAIPYFVIRARTDDVGLVLQADHCGRPAAASLGDRTLRIRPVCTSNQTTAGKSDGHFVFKMIIILSLNISWVNTFWKRVVDRYPLARFKLDKLKYILEAPKMSHLSARRCHRANVQANNRTGKNNYRAQQTLQADDG